MSFKGIDIRSSGDRVIVRAFLLDSSNAIVTSEGATLRLYEVQSDGSLKSYDFSSNTFKTTALTTETASLTHRQGNNNTTNTGVHTYALTTVSGFTRGNVYLAVVDHASAVPTRQVREFQYGDGEGDFTVDAGGQVTVGVNNDKNNYNLGTTQSFDNAGQSTALPGNVKAYNGTAVTGTYADDLQDAAGIAAAALSKANANGTTLTTVLTKIGSPANTSLANDIAAVKTDTGGIAATVWNALTSGLTTAGSVGKALAAFLAALGTDNRPKTSADAHTSGQTVAGLTGYVAPDNASAAAAASSAATAATQATSAASSAATAATQATGANTQATAANTAAAAVKTTTDKLALMINGTNQFTAGALANAPTGGTTGSGGVAGPGADPCTLTVTRPDGVTPIPDADVWLTAVAGSPTPAVAGTLQTDSNGRVTFLLNAGDTYYLWAQKDGEQDIRGQVFTAVKD